MTKAAGYARVSTAGQAEHGLGMDIQREAIAEFCAREGLELVQNFEDAGVSGANGVADREGWPLLVNGLEAGQFSTVIVLRLDRLARDLMLQENMLANVRELGGELVSVDEPDLCNGDPTRTLFRQMKGAISEYEKAMIVARLKAGRRKKVRQGGYAGGWLPYGYTTEGQGTEARPVVDQHAAETVRRVFAEYLNGASMKRIADGLTADGIPTARGGKWAQGTIAAILANPFYTGQVQSDGALVRGGHEAIVTAKQFRAAAKRMGEARRRGRPAAV